MERQTAQDLFDALIDLPGALVARARIEAVAVVVGTAAGDTPPMTYSVRIRMRTDSGRDLAAILNLLGAADVAVRLMDNEVVAT